jgi:hypothetical protein
MWIKIDCLSSCPIMVFYDGSTDNSMAVCKNLLYSRMLLGSILGPETGYLEWDFSLFSRFFLKMPRHWVATDSELLLPNSFQLISQSDSDVRWTKKHTAGDLIVCCRNTLHKGWSGGITKQAYSRGIPSDVNSEVARVELTVSVVYWSRAPGYRSRGPGFDSRRYQIFCEVVVGLERGPLSLVSITEELLEWKRIGFGSRRSRLTAVVIRCADHATPSVRKSWH